MTGQQGEEGGLAIEREMKKALLYETRENQKVVCNLCAHRCVIYPGLIGICGVRENRGGTLYTRVYDRIVSANVDPIEKKPLFHFLPGTRSFSIATAGCNFHCRFCQNWEISQMPKDRKGSIPGRKTTPGTIVREALTSGCSSIAYTYTEPTVFFELAYDTAKLASSRGLKNVFVTNGYMTAEALEMIRPYLDAANVDLKGFDDRRHRRICGAKLGPVLETIRLMKELGIWIEVTTLVIPGHNDSDEELRRIASFLLSLGEQIPWHLSAFFPAYRMMDGKPTGWDSLERAWRMGKETGLRHVYCGNIPGNPHENTECYRCGKTLIERWGFRVGRNVIKNGHCPFCEAVIAGVWRDPWPSEADAQAGLAGS